jgi:hypothetical protein
MTRQCSSYSFDLLGGGGHNARVLAVVLGVIFSGNGVIAAGTGAGDMGGQGVDSLNQRGISPGILSVIHTTSAHAPDLEALHAEINAGVVNPTTTLRSSQSPRANDPSPSPGLHIAAEI